MLVFTCASAAEAADIKKKMVVEQKKFYHGVSFFIGQLLNRKIALIQTGVGPRKAKTAANLITQNLSPSYVVLIGAAGAVDPLLTLGDTVIVERIIRKEGHIHDSKNAAIESTFFCHPKLSQTAFDLTSQKNLSPVKGDCLTTERFIHRRELKQWIHKTFNVKIIEMESAALGKIFSSRSLPFINVRIISDTSDKTIIDYEKIASRKNKHGRAGLALHFLVNPIDIIKLWRFRSAMQKVRNRLAEVVEILVEGLPREAPDNK